MASFSAVTPLIQWHEGMMLSPHHFQAMDLRNHQLLIHHLNLLDSNHYGIRFLEHDPITLAEGLLRLLEFEAVMPDGTLLSFNSHVTGHKPLEIDLKPFKDTWPEDGLRILLCVPMRRDGVSPLFSETPRLLSIEGPDVMDENLAGNPISIPRLVHNIFLHGGTDAPPYCHVLPIMHINWEDGVFSLSPFTPPSFYIERKTPMWNEAVRLASLMREKIGFLSDRWQNQIGTPLAYETESMLRPLMAALPRLETILKGQEVKPYTLYLTLADMIGALSSLKFDQPPPVLPVYEHNDLNKCFAPVLDFISNYLQSIELRFAIIPFAHKENLFSLRLHTPYVVDRRLYVGIKMRGTLNEVEEWIRTCVISCDTKLESTQKLRVTGAKRSILSGDELYAVMPGRGVLAFAVEAHDPFINLAEKLHIFHPGDSLQPSDLMLFVPREAKGDPKMSEAMAA